MNTKDAEDARNRVNWFNETEFIEIEIPDETIFWDCILGGLIATIILYCAYLAFN